MVDRSEPAGLFEFVVVAAARAKQLMRGALPRVEDHRKATTVAQREVVEGKVEKIAADTPAREGGDSPTGN